MAALWRDTAGHQQVGRLRTAEPADFPQRLERDQRAQAVTVDGVAAVFGHAQDDRGQLGGQRSHPVVRSVPEPGFPAGRLDRQNGHPR